MGAFVRVWEAARRQPPRPFWNHAEERASRQCCGSDGMRARGATPFGMARRAAPPMSALHPSMAARSGGLRWALRLSLERLNSPLLCRLRLLLGRQPALTEGRLLIRCGRQMPGAGRGWPNFSVDVHVEQEGSVGRHGVLEGALEVLRFGDGHGVDAAGLGPAGEVGIIGLVISTGLEHGAELAAPEHAELDVADRDPTEIVPDHPHDGDVVFDRGTQDVRYHGE